MLTPKIKEVAYCELWRSYVRSGFFMEWNIRQRSLKQPILDSNIEYQGMRVTINSSLSILVNNNRDN